MRADRLVAIVLLLQSHGQRTVGQLAEALEASERTIRRDLESLCAAGVPLYAQRGRGGGWALPGRHRIDLSGLTATEARSLVLAASGAPGQHGVDGALRKVLAALPPVLRAQVMVARSHLHVDRTSWRDSPGDPGRQDSSRTDRWLEPLRQAIDQGVQVRLCYARPGQQPTWRQVHPHGLVVKQGSWYLVATAPSGLRTYKVARVDAVEPTADPAVTPAGFDLAATWELNRRAFAQLRPATEVRVEVFVEPQVWPRFSEWFGEWWDVTDLGVEADGRRRALVVMTNVAHAARELTVFADAVEVGSPPAVRAELATIGQHLVARYCE